MHTRLYGATVRYRKSDCVDCFKAVHYHFTPTPLYVEASSGPSAARKLIAVGRKNIPVAFEVFLHPEGPYLIRIES